MMSNDFQSSGDFDDEMSEYLQTFLDETEEQLDDLVETLLALERDSKNEENLNESFRLIHSIKGSAGMMGLDPISVLTHHLENRFERFRSGTEILDKVTMNLVLRCVDFLRQCTDRLRQGEALGSPSELLEELRRLEKLALEEESDPIPGNSAATSSESDTKAPDADDEPSNATETAHQTSEDANASIDQPTRPGVSLIIRFRDGLQLVDLKAQLILNRLASLGEIESSRPAIGSLADLEQLNQLEVDVACDCSHDQIREAADVDGVESIDLQPRGESAQVDAAKDSSSTASDIEEIDASASKSVKTESEVETPVPTESMELASSADRSLENSPLENSPLENSPIGDSKSVDEQGSETTATQAGPETQGTPSTNSSFETQAHVNVEESVTKSGVERTQLDAKTASKTGEEKTSKVVAETMRVGIDRLDNLMNLAGELVVNRAQFVQIADQLTPIQQRVKTMNRLRAFGDVVQRTIDRLELDSDSRDQNRSLAEQLRAGLAMLNQNSDAWEQERRNMEKFGEAIDQLSRVSQGLQRGVLDTRMVPVGPLFNRFKRVVRDLSLERDKQVELAIHGEKTELDKRMIDELGDPLMHLIRNAIDHGLEPTDDRIEHGKSATGVISLEAAHSGNNVYIYVRDDGRGIDVEKIKAKLVRKGLATIGSVAELSDEQALEYIWHPGFSTADQITEVSGRGVGMDVVQDRVRDLNGSLTVDSTPGRGTQFTIRLPLTLAIINCLLVRLKNVIFSMPIDHVREIVSVRCDEVVKVRGQRTIDVRDELIPLMSIDDIFDWNTTDIDVAATGDATTDTPSSVTDVVILQATGKTLGLRVDELLGSQDMVIKSLTDNFVDIAGLSGASILGDGSVCLMLDVGTIFRLIGGPSLRSDAQNIKVDPGQD
ncbi:MAG: chemotaxis protein CheW [Planctomycetota bacterium]